MRRWRTCNNARESGPPLTATTTDSPPLRSPRRSIVARTRSVRSETARPVAIGSGRGGVRAQDACEPGVRIGQLGDGREVLGALPDEVQALHPRRVGDGGDERFALR